MRDVENSPGRPWTGRSSTGRTSSRSTSVHKVTPKATGKQITLEEVAVYTVNKDDKITREQFFFEGSR